MSMPRPRHAALIALLTVALNGCSIRQFAINKVGDALASGDSVYESDDDIELVGQALPFSLKLVESLLSQSPEHRGLLLTACRGFVLYAYAYVQYESEVQADFDLDRARHLRARARRLYLRGFAYGTRGLELYHPGFAERLERDPEAAVRALGSGDAAEEMPLAYWTAAALGLAVSASKNDAALLARIPEVEALLERCLELDEAWDEGALHEFHIILAGSKPGRVDRDAIQVHFDRALELSRGRRASLYLAYAETVSIPAQDAAQFRLLLGLALAVDPDEAPQERLANLIAQRRARWLMRRIDELILPLEPPLDT